MSILPDLAAVCLWKLAQIRGNHMSSTLDYSAITLPLISEVVKVYRAAIIDRTDGVLLHARFLSSVGGRIRRLAHSKRKQSRRPRTTEQVQGVTAKAEPRHLQSHTDSSPTNTSAATFKLDQLFGVTPSAAQGTSVNPLQQTMPMYSEFDDIFEGINLDSAIPGVPDTTMPDFDLAFNNDNIGGNGGILGNGNFVDPLSSMQGHPLGAFSFDMDLMSLLNGSMNPNQAQTTLMSNGSGSGIVGGMTNGSTIGADVSGLNGHGMGGLTNGTTSVGNGGTGGDLNWPFSTM